MAPRARRHRPASNRLSDPLLPAKEERSRRAGSHRGTCPLPCAGIDRPGCNVRSRPTSRVLCWTVIPARATSRYARAPTRTDAGHVMRSPGQLPGQLQVAEPADKPGPVLDSHSSRRSVTATLKQPTRRHCGPQCCLPIWPCSRWGLPCRPVARLAVRSYRTISPLPRIPKDRSAVSFCCTFRRLAPPRRYLAPCPVEPGLSSAFFRMTRLPGRLRRRRFYLCRACCNAAR